MGRKRILVTLLILASGVAAWIVLRPQVLSEGPPGAEPHGVRQDAPSPIERDVPSLRGTREAEGGSAVNAAPAHGRWVEVTVVDVATDEPVAEFAVWGHGALERRMGRTDAAGVVRLGPFGPGSISLDPRPSGWLLAEPLRPIADASEDARARILLRRGLPISGEVLEPGDVPAAGAWVVAQQGTKEARTDTDADGVFRFPALSSGQWTVRVQKHFGGPFVHSVAALAGMEDLVIRLKRALPRELVVHVLAPDGTPIPAFDFAWAGAGGSATGDWTGPLSVGPGSKARWVEITKPRDEAGEPLPYGPGSVGPIASDETKLEIRLGKEERITGRFLDPEGKPVPDVQVRAWPLDRGPATGHVAGFHDEIRSDSEGVFRLTRLAATTYRLHIEAGHDFEPVQQLTVEAGTEDLVVRLQSGHGVELVVLDPLDNPVPAALVSVNRLGSFVFGKTDKAGKYLVPGIAKDGRYPLVARPPSSRPDLAVLVVAGWQPSELRLQLPGATPLRGHVVDSEGRPVAGAYVNGVGDDGASYGVTATPAGEFSLPHVARGLLLLRATKDDALSPVMDVSSGGHDIKLVLRPGASLSVVFRAWPNELADVQAIMWMPTYAYGASASVVQPDGRATFARLDPDATYTLFLRIGEGKDQMVAWAPSLQAGAALVEIPLRPAHSITGTVTIPGDAQLPTIKVNQHGVVAETTAASSGHFTLTGLPEGTWTVTATASGVDGNYSGEAKGRTGGSVQIDLGR